MDIIISGSPANIAIGAPAGSIARVQVLRDPLGVVLSEGAPTGVRLAPSSRLGVRLPLSQPGGGILY